MIAVRRYAVGTVTCCLLGFVAWLLPTHGSAQSSPRLNKVIEALDAIDKLIDRPINSQTIIDNYSFFEDIKIIYKTIASVISRKGAN